MTIDWRLVVNSNNVVHIVVCVVVRGSGDIDTPCPPDGLSVWVPDSAALRASLSIEPS